MIVNRGVSGNAHYLQAHTGNHDVRPGSGACALQRHAYFYGVATMQRDPGDRMTRVRVRERLLSAQI